MTKIKTKKLKAKKPIAFLLNDISLGSFIKTLKISPEQETFLLGELSKMDGKERLELLGTLTKVYALNQDEDRAIKRLEDNWESL